MNYLQKQLSSKTGSVSIVVFAVLVGVYVVTTQLFGDNTRVVDLIRTVLAIAWIVQVLLFIGLSVHDVGKEKGTKNYAHSWLYVLGKVFLYLLLPCFIITALLIALALLIQQPTFR